MRNENQNQRMNRLDFVFEFDLPSPFNQAEEGVIGTEFSVAYMDTGEGREQDTEALK